jgi:hypothetical protein
MPHVTNKTHRLRIDATCFEVMQATKRVQTYEVLAKERKGRNRYRKKEREVSLVHHLAPVEKESSMYTKMRHPYMTMSMVVLVEPSVNLAHESCPYMGPTPMYRRETSRECFP